MPVPLRPTIKTFNWISFPIASIPKAPICRLYRLVSMLAPLLPLRLVIVEIFTILMLGFSDSDSVVHINMMEYIHFERIQKSSHSLPKLRLDPEGKRADYKIFILPKISITRILLKIVNSRAREDADVRRLPRSAHGLYRKYRR